MVIKWKNKDRKERERKDYKINRKWAMTLIVSFVFFAAGMVIMQYGNWYANGITLESDFTYWWGTRIRWLLIWMLVIAALPWIYGSLYKNPGSELRFFQTPVEIPGAALLFLFGYISNYGWGLISVTGGCPDIFDLLLWAFIFGVVYWCSACFRPIYQMGPLEFVKRQSLMGRMLRWLGQKWKRIRKKIKLDVENMVESWKRIDFKQENSKVLFKIVGVHFLILVIILLLIPSLITAVLVYSVMLFFLLRYLYRKLGQKYSVLLQATNKIADGNLDVKIEEDLWIFNPLKRELEQIQDGFKNAVEKEMKSRHMKTELITNVSHDLKTPLTAIITYVSLLKKESDIGKQKEYIDVLERKSLRLKALIEDLFEISKVSSHNVKLDLADVDVTHLMKQVILELEDKIQTSGIEFRCQYPQEKVHASLDGQVTFRIFENLIVNITKYAMPGTRAYIEIEEVDGTAVIKMKNVSAAELSFSPEELTERFVRGDRARNTEGSGLGLAIAKSFTEIQNGTFKIETEADLFKVELRF